jgi:hypothetical protein
MAREWCGLLSFQQWRGFASTTSLLLLLSVSPKLLRVEISFFMGLVTALCDKIIKMGSDYGDKGNRKGRSLRAEASLFATKCFNLWGSTRSTTTTSNKKTTFWWLPILSTLCCIQGMWWLFDQLPAPRIELPKVFPPIHSHRILPNASSPLVPFYEYYSMEEPYYTGPPKVFSTWPTSNAYAWCGPLVSKDQMGSRSDTKEGLLYIKEMKTGSTTLSGVTARIARNVAQRHRRSSSLSSTNTTTTIVVPNTVKENELACTSRFVHLRARRLKHRNRTASFLWSVVREPTARLVSKFFHFNVGREGVAATLKAFQKFVQDNEVYDYAYYFKSLSLRQKLNPFRTEFYDTFLQEILDGYDFLGVSERMDESLVVLQLLLGLETQDLLHVSTKTSGTYDYFPQAQKCIYMAPAQITFEMKQWFYTDDFEYYVAPDILVYQAVNQSLDATIETLGRDRVHRGVKQLLWAQSMAREQCAASTIKFPCTAQGQRQEQNDCLQQDVACGYKCLDQVGAQLAEKKEYQRFIE